MTVASAIHKWRETLARRDRSGVAAAKRSRAETAAAYDVANAPCASIADFVAKLRYARHDVAERGIVDRVVLVLLDGLIADAARLAGAPLQDDEIATANERTMLDVRRMICRGLPSDYDIRLHNQLAK